MTRQQHLSQILTERLLPNYLSIVDESAKHRGHAGAESHFKVVIASTEFNGLSRIERHRLIYTCLDAQLVEKKIHALSLYLYTPDEWQNIDKERLKSPACHNKDSF